jgi:ubiquinone/menaquinone biosynthesis C-methylase UbiE
MAPRSSKKSGRARKTGHPGRGLPALYPFVAADTLKYCRPADGLWVDLGCGDGGVGLELARTCRGTVLLIDPDEEALQRAVAQAQEADLPDRVAAIRAQAEALPLRDGVAELVVSRGSAFFWDDPPAGLREVCRVLRPGATAMIGGGLGEGYPQWARQEFTRRRHQSVRSRGPEAYAEFKRVRHPETFRAWADEAGLENFEVIGEGGRSPDTPDAGLGIWLRFTKV